MTTQFMFKMEPKLKKAAMKKARENGVTFSYVLNLATSAFVNGDFHIGLIVNEKLNPHSPKTLPLNPPRTSGERGGNVAHFE